MSQQQPQSSSKALRKLFDLYASIELPSSQSKQERALSQEDFARLLADTHSVAVASAPAATTSTTDRFEYSPARGLRDAKDAHYALLFKVADRSAAGRLTFNDFVLFENLLSKPDAEYEIAFRVFDTDGNGKLTFGEFKQFLERNLASSSSSSSSSSNEAPVPINFQSDWFKLVVGADAKRAERRELGYEEFSQLLKGLQSERLRQEFKHYDTDQDGAIDADAFKRLMAHTAKHKLSDDVVKQLPTLANVYPGKKITFSNVAAFYTVVRNMDLVEQVVRAAIRESSDGRITKADFMHASSRVLRFAMFSPMETDILFHFASLGASAKAGGRLGMDDFAKLLDPSFGSEKTDKQHVNELARRAATASAGATSAAADHPHHHLSPAMQFVKGAYSFALGSVAGAVGAFSIYPIDLVKTRMQNQRSAVVGEMLYKNSFDCFGKVIRQEGFLGLYSGLGPQLIGVAPEKAIKLTMNDLVRSLIKDEGTGEIPLWGEVLAGCTAGGSQVIFTNPLEIVKIRLQVQGQTHVSSSSTSTAATNLTAPERQSAIQIIRSLGLLGLYKGAGACLLRDIPFSGIYFTAYAHIKKDYFHEGPDHKLSMGELLLSGAMAGMPAAYLTTPADVIKTRLQVKARAGQTTYSGITDAARKIYAEEGFRAFFKGGPARIFRSSPQFGVTLMTYELLQQSFPFPWSAEAADAAEAAAAAASLAPGQQLASTYAKLGISAPELAKIDNTFIKSRNAIRILQDVDYKFGSSSKSSK